MIAFSEWLKQRQQNETFAVSPSIVDEEKPIVDAGTNRGAFPFYSKEEMPITKKNCGCKSRKFSQKK